jgi:hypothetical protein
MYSLTSLFNGHFSFEGAVTGSNMYVTHYTLWQLSCESKHVKLEKCNMPPMDFLIDTPWEACICSYRRQNGGEGPSHWNCARNSLALRGRFYRDCGGEDIDAAHCTEIKPRIFENTNGEIARKDSHRSGNTIISGNCWSLWLRKHLQGSSEVLRKSSQHRRSLDRELNSVFLNTKQRCHPAAMFGPKAQC